MHWIRGGQVPPDIGGPVATLYSPLQGPDDRQLGLEDVERVAARYPDKIALDDGRLKLTYAEVLDRAYGLAEILARMVEPGRPIASFIHNSVAGPIIILASAAAGLTLIPIDAGHPTERTQAILEESGAEAIVLCSRDGLADDARPGAVASVVFDPGRPSGARRFAIRRAPERTPIFVIFTSGSTGRPKGVAYDRTDGLRLSVDAFHVNSTDVILGLASLSTGGAGHAFLALTTGATLRIVDIMREGVGETLRVMAADGVTILSFVPTVLRGLMAVPGVEQAFQSLRVLDLHGEATLQSDIALFRTKLPADCHISITFSATETGAMFSWFVDEAAFQGSSVPVGRLVSGKEMALLQDDGRPSPTGAVGELVVRGRLAAGSWQKGRLTQWRFVADPLDPSRSIYHTGDLVRLREDGLVEFVGRRDRQVKIRGLWADLLEVEEALRALRGVIDAVVIVQPGADQLPQIVAVISIGPGAPVPSLAEVRAEASRATAPHMAPHRLEVVKAIPRLANYKPDLVRLDAMFGASSTS